MSEQSSVGLLVVDIQGKLAELVDQSEALLSSTKKLIKCCSVLSIPIVVLEQNPEGLGPTHKTLTTDLGDFDPLAKFCFNGLDEVHTVEQIKQSNIQQRLVVSGWHRSPYLRVPNGIGAYGPWLRGAGSCGVYFVKETGKRGPCD